jgi:NADPH-dependent 2,4-dienoyl-CoA reductase/sulfur reductase-like enzyme
LKILEADVAVIGGGFGAVAATLALLQNGRTVVMVEEYPCDVMRVIDQMRLSCHG